MVTYPSGCSVFILKGNCHLKLSEAHMIEVDELIIFHNGTICRKSSSNEIRAVKVPRL